MSYGNFLGWIWPDQNSTDSSNNSTEGISTDSEILGGGGNTTQLSFELPSGYIIPYEAVFKLIGALCFLLSYLLLCKEKAKHVKDAAARAFFEEMVPNKDTITTYNDPTKYRYGPKAEGTTTNLRPRCMSEKLSTLDQAWRRFVSCAVSEIGTMVFFGVMLAVLYSALRLLRRKVEMTEEVVPDFLSLVFRPGRVMAEAEGYKWLGNIVLDWVCQYAGIDPRLGKAGFGLAGAGAGWKIIKTVKSSANL